jgi:hypothetical protein
MRPVFALILAATLCLASLPCAAAGLGDVLNAVQEQLPSSGSAKSGAGLSDGEIGQGLKEALAQGTQKAVTTLGRADGYFGDQAVRILLPESLRSLETPLRLAGQSGLLDSFVLSMNRAAEKAVPEAASILADAVRAMTVSDARAILSGPDDSATHYFQKTSAAKIAEKMRPIVAQATESVGATKAYKNLTASPAASVLAQAGGLDLDGYVTQKAVDGLFLMVGKEEKDIRANPAARSTDLLRKVFGSR